MTRPADAAREHPLPAEGRPARPSTLPAAGSDADPSPGLTSVFCAAAHELPLPGRGRTLERWERLAGWARRDLVAARLAEAHADAVAIAHDLGLPGLVEEGTRWGVWAAEPPRPVLRAVPSGGGGWTLRGIKPWCSGASGSTHALVTARVEPGPAAERDAREGAGPTAERDAREGAGRGPAEDPGEEAVALFAVDLSHPGVAPVPGTWNAVGMAASDSGSVAFDDVPARRIASHAEYLARPGFWHGGMGVAACWFGGARALAEPLLDRALRPGAGELLRARAGSVASELAAGWSLLRAAAAEVDARPDESGPLNAARALAVRTRIDRLADAVARGVGRALGPGPLCADADHARLAADLAVYVRQSHAERDEAGVADALAEHVTARAGEGSRDPVEAGRASWDELIGLGPAASAATAAEASATAAETSSAPAGSSPAAAAGTSPARPAEPAPLPREARR